MRGSEFHITVPAYPNLIRTHLRSGDTLSFKQFAQRTYLYHYKGMILVSIYPSLSFSETADPIPAVDPYSEIPRRSKIKAYSLAFISYQRKRPEAPPCPTSISMCRSRRLSSVFVARSCATHLVGARNGSRNSNTHVVTSI